MRGRSGGRQWSLAEPHEVVAEFEEQLDKPLITSTQATFWHLLRSAGINSRVPGYGRLIAQH